MSSTIRSLSVVACWLVLAGHPGRIFANGGQAPADPSTALPKIEPGTVRQMSIEELSDSGKQYFLRAPNPKSSAVEPTTGARIISSTTTELSIVSLFAAKARKEAEAEIAGGITAVSGTALAAFDYVGAVAEASIDGAPKRRLSRVFRDSERSYMLTEWGYVADGGGIVQFSEFVNTKVGERPGVLTVRKDDKGAALWRLSWADDSRDYQLYMYQPSFDPMKGAALAKIADQISASRK